VELHGDALSAPPTSLSVVRNGAVDWHAGRLWSLWDIMWKLNAHTFYSTSMVLQRISVALKVMIDKQGLKKETPVSEKYRKNLLPQIETLRDEIAILGTSLTFKSISRLGADLERDSITYERLLNHLDEIDSRLQDELSSATVIVIDEKLKDLCFPTGPLFGEEVELKFPQMSEDIAEAGKCLAFVRPTASVFHLMRVMEIAVQKFGDKLGVKLVNDLNWQVILDQINKAIRALDHRLPETKKLAEAASHLYNVKVAWRNEVMHPKQTYTPEEADEIFKNVRSFIQRLEKFM
jgi:hypothetical protein